MQILTIILPVGSVINIHEVRAAPLRGGLAQYVWKPWPSTSGFRGQVFLERWPSKSGNRGPVIWNTQ
jgi:hypothetical protein